MTGLELFLLYWRGLIGVSVVLPLVTIMYDKEAFKQENWQVHMITIVILYPVMLPVLFGMRLTR